MNLFSNLKLDTWYKICIVFGGGITMISLLSSAHSSFIALGLFLFFIGIGEWKNTSWVMMERTQTIHNPYMNWSAPFKRHTILGTLFYIIGIVSLIYFLILFSDEIQIIFNKIINIF